MRVGGLHRGDLDLGSVACIRQRQRHHRVHRRAQRERHLARWLHHRQRAAGARVTTRRIVNAALVSNAAVSNTAIACTAVAANAGSAVAVSAIANAAADAAVTGAAGATIAVSTITACANPAGSARVHVLDCATQSECWRRRDDRNGHRYGGGGLRVDSQQQRLVDHHHVRREWHGKRARWFQHCGEHSCCTNRNRDDRHSDLHGDAGGRRIFLLVFNLADGGQHRARCGSGNGERDRRRGVFVDRGE